MIAVKELNIYPVKSLGRISLESAELCIRGLKYDRNWMLVTEDNVFITQRNLPKMALIQLEISDQNLIFTTPGFSDLVVPIAVNVKTVLKCQVWDDVCDAVDVGKEAEKWLTEVLGKYKNSSLRLVKMLPDYRRQVAQKYLKAEDAYTAFADGFPYLVTSTASLAALNEKLVNKGESAVPMARFRSNIVVDGADAFIEDRSTELMEINQRYKLGIRKPCQRCKIITIDPSTAEIENPKEPLKTLAEMNPFPDKTGAFFGQNATLLSSEGALIRVGDQLEFV